MRILLCRPRALRSYKSLYCKHLTHYSSGPPRDLGAREFFPVSPPLSTALSVAPYKVHGALAPSVPPIKVFSVYHLHAPPPGRNVPLQWLVPQFGMASL